MSILRLLVAWLVMAALPLQGFAAASMLFCDQGARSTAPASAAHDHASHGHGEGHDRDGHSSAAVGHDRASHDAGVAAQLGSKLSQQQDSSAQPPGATAVDDGHACPICASCCNLVALTETPTLSLEAAAPTAQPPQGAERVTTRHAPAPDKPPRA